MHHGLKYRIFLAIKTSESVLENQISYITSMTIVVLCKIIFTGITLFTEISIRKSYYSICNYDLLSIYPDCDKQIDNAWK